MFKLLFLILVVDVANWGKEGHVLGKVVTPARVY
jgi:hypothetical protein